MTRLFSSDELTSHEFPNPSYLIEPLMPMGGIGILHGKPNVGKTQFVMTLAEAINSGEPLFGRWPVHQGAVVMIQADMTGPIQQQRLIRLSTRTQLTDTYWLAEEDGSAPFIDIITMSLTKRALVDAIREIDPVLIVWDTLRKVHLLDENASKTPIEVFNAARRICPLAFHLFVHHNRKESRDPDASPDTDEAFMGNQQWKGSSDTTMSLKEIGTSPKRVLFETHKARTAPDTEKHPLILELDMESMLLLPMRRYSSFSPSTHLGLVSEARARHTR